MPVVAEGQVLECQGVAHGTPGGDVAQKNMAQIDITISITAASLGPSPMRSVPRTVLRRGLLVVSLCHAHLTLDPAAQAL